MLRRQKSRTQGARQSMQSLPVGSPNGNDQANKAQPSGSPGIAWSGRFMMKTILLADHNADHLLQHGDILGRAGYRIVTALDAKSALFILESGMLLDLIVTEYEMPDMRAPELLAALRCAAPSVPVIVATSSDSVENYIHAVSLGVYDYLNKPLLPAELRCIAKNAIDARQAGGCAGLA